MRTTSKSLITIDMHKTKLKPIHPGEVLRDEFLEPFGLSQYRVAIDVGVSPRRINEIVQGERALTADTALRLGHYFGMSPLFWLNLQSHYDLECRRDTVGARLKHRIKAFRPA